MKAQIVGYESFGDYHNRRSAILGELEGPVQSIDELESQDQWWLDHKELAKLVEWLSAEEDCWTSGEICELLEKPWKWAREYQAMKRNVTYENFLMETDDQGI